MKLILSLAAGLLSAGLATAQTVSTDGSCAGTNNYSCQGSAFGNCCSKFGWCGSSTAHCGSGCNEAYGTCSGSTTPSRSSSAPVTTPTVKVSTDASCGGTSGYTCLGSSFGNCCSSSGWCGSTSAYCGSNCQSGFGNCGSNDGASSSTTKTSTPVPLPSGASSALECLNGKDVPYKMTSDGDYSELVAPYNLRLPYNPAVVVLPTTNQHVQDAVICAGQSGLKVQAKSGGHSYGNFGNGGKDGSMVINLQSLQTIQLDKTTGIATVGGGVRLGNLADGLFTQGKAAVSHGTCPGVGIGGHYTHGGYSHTSRNFGLAMDQIVAADVVLADGSLIKASQTENTEIFWAIRGAAEFFGIITNFYLQTRAAPESITYFSFPMSSAWNSRTTFTNTLLHIQDVATNASVVDDRISFGIYLDGYNTFSFSGAFFGSVEEFNTNIKPELLRTLPVPSSSTVKSYSWYDYLVLVSGESTIKVPTTGYAEHENFFAKSLTVPESDGLTANSINAFYDYIKRGTNVDFYVIINLYGGPGSAINSKDTDFAAYSDRDSLWVLQNWGYNNAGTDAVSFINGLNSAIVNAQPQTNFGAYLNYIDASLDAATAHKLYYGDALYEKLAALKKTVDPGNVFWNPLGISA